LLGRNYYRRITFNDNFVEVPVRVLDNDYLFVTTYEAHNCVSKQMFLIVDLNAGDIHVALYHYGSLEWFHTRGNFKDLPKPILDELHLQMGSPRAVREITRGAIQQFVGRERRERVSQLT
jgi:hypothetical protein